MTPSGSERDELFKGFARALFKGDMDALYRIVAPDFVWSFHDGLATTKKLARARGHSRASGRAEGKILGATFSRGGLSACGRRNLHDVPRQRNVRADGEQRGVEVYTFRDGLLATKTSIASRFDFAW